MKKLQPVYLHDKERQQYISVKGEDVLARTTFWKNPQYKVECIRYEEYTHIVIERRDKKATRAWSHFQQIKNQLCGEDKFGYEVYPPQAEVIDVANKYHLWVFNDPTMRFRFPEGRQFNGN